MEWLNANDIQPQDETGVVGYSKQWIDKNSNAKGLRICYYNNGKWSSVNYSKEEGKFVITEEKPETWTVISFDCSKEQDDMYNFLSELKNN